MKNEAITLLNKALEINSKAEGVKFKEDSIIFLALAKLIVSVEIIKEELNEKSK